MVYWFVRHEWMRSFGCRGIYSKKSSFNDETEAREEFFQFILDEMNYDQIIGNCLREIHYNSSPYEDKADILTKPSYHVSYFHYPWWGYYSFWIVEGDDKGYDNGFLEEYFKGDLASKFDDF